MLTISYIPQVNEAIASRGSPELLSRVGVASVALQTELRHFVVSKAQRYYGLWATKN